MITVALPLSAGTMTMLGSPFRVWRALRCSVDKLALGGFACRRAALTPSLSVSDEL